MKSMFLILAFFTTYSLSFGAQAQQACFETEKNVLTKKVFTEEDWKSTLKDWSASEPSSPGYVRLLLAWNLYNTEEAALKKIKGDKRKHCYMGCRIAQDISLETAIYVAWYKEKKDLTDCSIKTLFEEYDYEVTLKGAEMGQENSDSEYCLDQCNALKRR